MNYQDTFGTRGRWDTAEIWRRFSINEIEKMIIVYLSNMPGHLKPNCQIPDLAGQSIHDGSVQPYIIKTLTILW